MSDLSEDDLISLPRDTLILNTLAMGVAIQFLAKITGETIEAWKDYIGEKATEQHHQLSAEQIEKILEELKSL